MRVDAPAPPAPGVRLELHVELAVDDVVSVKLVDAGTGASAVFVRDPVERGRPRRKS